LTIYIRGFELACRVRDLSIDFPRHEQFSLTDQVRRSSRSVCANIAEAWRKRRYRAAFIAKLNDAEAEAAETQVWLDFAKRDEYADSAVIQTLIDEYEVLLRSLVATIGKADQWCLPNADPTKSAK
jgi:four helix bundle protein